jgi:hypothetical protein
VIAIAIVRTRDHARVPRDCEIPACFFSSLEKSTHR